MTRKRYIKLLMSYGVSRNSAVKVAKAVNDEKKSYEEAYLELPEVISKLLTQMCDVVRKLIADIPVVVNSLYDAAKKLAEQTPD